MPEQLDLFAEAAKTAAEPAPQAAPGPRTLYFDLETQKSADEVGGWGNTHLMKLAVGVVWDSLEQRFFSFLEPDAGQLAKKLRSADLVVGFNVIGFDYPVLQPYADFDLQDIKTFDMLLDIRKKLGFRLSLDHLAQNTLKAQKSADGLISLQWFREGKIDQIVEYCQKDVALTRDLFLYGESHGHVLYQTRSGTVQKVQVDWKTANLI